MIFSKPKPNKPDVIDHEDGIEIKMIVGFSRYTKRERRDLWIGHLFFWAFNIGLQGLFLWAWWIELNNDPEPQLSLMAFGIVTAGIHVAILTAIFGPEIGDMPPTSPNYDTAKKRSRRFKKEKKKLNKNASFLFTKVAEKPVLVTQFKWRDWPFKAIWETVSAVEIEAGGRFIRDSKEMLSYRGGISGVERQGIVPIRPRYLKDSSGVLDTNYEIEALVATLNQTHDRFLAGDFEEPPTEIISSPVEKPSITPSSGINPMD